MVAIILNKRIAENSQKSKYYDGLWLIMALLLMLPENNEINGRPRAKIYKQRKIPFDLPNIEFRYKYRFSKRVVNKIVNMLKPDLVLNQRGSGTSPHLQVLTALRCWGRREVQDDAGDLHGLSQPTVSRICAKVSRALAKHAKDFISMPKNLEEEKESMNKFYKIRFFPAVIGAIDCTHIRIKKVGGANAQYYVNRKGYYSLNVQMVCDAKLKIQNVIARWRGSTHDSRIFNESMLKREFEENRYRGRLVGDSGYKQTSYLFTPLLRPTSAKEEKYNAAHISTRNVIERCFGVLKQRFRCLLDGLRISYSNAKILIVALSVLHNIAIQENESIPDFLTALTNMTINVPRAVKRGGNTILMCNYDVEVTRLYSIKWYKGKKEFYRYMPNEVPNVKIFPVSNLKVEVMLSNQTHLLLQDMQPENSGKYTCEISNDAPDFTTAMRSGELEVVELPKEQAIVTGIHPRYRIGDLVDGNCSIKFSKPAANLTWTINGIVVPPHHIKAYQIEKHENSSLESVMSALNFMVTTQHFIKGKMRLKCTASIFGIFKEEIETIIEEDRPRIMASGQSYDMHNYAYGQQHTKGDGFEDHNESYLTYYSAADTTSGSSSTFTSKNIIQKLKSHFERIGLKFFALARKAQQIINGFTPLTISTKTMSLQHQTKAGHIEHEKIRLKSLMHSLPIVCYCIVALTIILTHHFMSCQNTKTTTTKAIVTGAYLKATKSTSLSSSNSNSSTTNTNKSFYNCPEKSVKARKISLQKLQTSMTLQRQQCDCQCDDDNINDDDCEQRQQEQKQQIELQLQLQLKEHTQVQVQRMLWTLPAFIESTKCVQVSSNSNGINIATSDMLLSLSKDQILLMIPNRNLFLKLKFLPLYLLLLRITSAFPNLKIAHETSFESSFTFFLYSLKLPFPQYSSMFHYNQRQFQYC